MSQVLAGTTWNEREYLLRIVAAYAVATFQRNCDTSQGSHIHEPWQRRFVAAVLDGNTPVDTLITRLREGLHAKEQEVSGQSTEKKCVIHDNKVRVPKPRTEPDP